MKKVFLFLLIVSIGCFGQTESNYALIDAKMDEIPSSSTSSTDKIANYINANFKTENDKIRAVFYWIASNISYDIKKITARASKEVNPHDNIPYTLKTQKGICGDYAEVFSDISSKIGITTYIVVGYTKQKGKIASLSHAWCAAKIDDKWFLFDPTFGAGYINNNKFTKKLNNGFFKVEPSKLIASHMPFDYLWQFLNYPITNKEFYEDKISEDKSKAYFDFENEIVNYNKLSDSDKANETAVRIEKNGVLNGMISEALNYNKELYKNLIHNKNSQKLTQESQKYNEAITFLNNYSLYRSKKFQPAVSDEDLKAMLQNIKDRFKEREESLDALGDMGNEYNLEVKKFKKSILAINKQIQEHESFLNSYLSKSPEDRKMMFNR